MGKSKTEKSPKKSKQEKSSSEKTKEKIETEETEFNPANISAISFPMAEVNLKKKLLKVVKKATKHKHVKRGIKEVVKGIRKGDKGLVVLAGNISPIDVISHVPVLCEENNVPYIYVNSKEELGFAGLTKRPTSCIMIIPGGKGGKAPEYDEYKESFVEVSKTIKTINENAFSSA
ncbi:hypothetical protein BB559_001500 [Furculomyces boomerangus]|uniref:H/ACA ribonucleoprotein complex subunit 2 n=2 Tax=Harpellales TaxID=61421 RepID=A0A2T9Z1W7_9FUNG|nr:hypothetical protein BB559_001500 [Furculomyces boomerangus]PVZ96569.1 hypothetical protein BB558_007513 [Smittium angustum]PWA01708.1 hypothetical protein BB558_002177 [Smittium angustum]